MMAYNPAGDSNLYDEIEMVTKQIKDVYDELISCDIDNNTSYKKECIGNLKRLRALEKDLYKEAFSKQNRSIAFYALTSQLYDISLEYPVIYEDFVASIYDLKQVGRRILLNVLFNYKQEAINGSYEESKEYANDDMEFVYKFSYTRNKISLILCELVYHDMFNVLLHSLEEEISKSNNFDIKDELIKAKYYLLLCNPNLEDNYIDNDFMIDNYYHLGHNILFELDNPTEGAKKSFYRQHFKPAIDSNIKNLVTMSKERVTPGVKRFLVLYEKMLSAILSVSDNSCYSDIIDSYNACKGNINNTYSDKVINNLGNNRNNKILRMSLYKKNISK